ncbi:uncharacterized protein LOC116301700 isoform X2 [Actinia tenebrosa]|uniref:Uncharacterized protein LOC116301700 isoform X2 n=1 Tax=Actinia tenebrosa TaxID=6105 RepID=A0A6P8IIM3_ACTTE|nr:uncharacterized protein LOC116301700 isoform X2 [Actinia tenebrosa]
MALNRELESLQDDSVPKFEEFSWSQQDVKGKRRIIEAEIVSGQSSPKKMAIELTSDDGGSPVVTQICSLVSGDDDDVEHQIDHPSVEYLNNGATIQVYEMPPETNTIDIKRVEEHDDRVDTEEVIINGFPVYQLEGNAPFLNETLQLCMGKGLDQRYICSKVPVNILQNALFVVDFQCVRHHDVVAMDKGSFGRQSSPTRHVAIKVLPDGRVEDIKTVKFLGADALEPGYEYYKIRRHYTWHKCISGLSRVITRLEYKNVLFRYGVVQFKMNEEDKSFASNFKPQPTSKADKTQRSTPRGSLEGRAHAQTDTSPVSHNQAHKTTPSRYISALNSTQSPPRIPIESSEGSFSGSAQSEQPSTTPSDASSCKGEILHILKNADKPKPLLGGEVPDFSKLLNLLKCEDFLCDVSFVSVVNNNVKSLNPRTFAMGELQKHWLNTYCSGENPKSVVNISTRYKIGSYYLTMLTCSLPIFVFRDDPSAKHPMVLLGLMTSMTNSSEDYEYLASNLRRQGIKSMVYGTNGNFSLDAALERTFPTQERSLLNSSSISEKSIHICCFDKMREDICLKLDELNVKNAESKIILRQILGSPESDKTSNDSLVDQKSEVKFREMLATLEKKWPVAFRNWFTSSTDNSDRSLSETVKKCMLRPVRILAGLGNPPIKYSNKNNYSKFVIDAVSEIESFGPVDLVKIHEIIKLKAVESQITEFVKAMYNMGELRLANAYQHLKVSLIS